MTPNSMKALPATRFMEQNGTNLRQTGPMMHQRSSGQFCARILLPALLVATAAQAQFPAETQAQGANAPSGPADTAETSRARQTKLDALFGALKKAASDAEAAEFVAEIWRIWSQSGRADVDAMMARVSSGMQNMDFGVARLLLDEIVEIAPDFAEGWNRRATLRYMMGDHEGALEDIDRALAIESRHFGALTGRAMIHAAADRWQQALADYKAALSANPFLPDRMQALPMLQKKAEENKL